MGVGIDSAFRLQVSDVHGDHCCLLFFHIDELAEPELEGFVEVDPVSLAALQPRDVVLSQEYLAIFDDEKWPLNASWISEEANLFVRDVSDDRDFLGDLHATPQFLDLFDKVISVVVSANPPPVDEDLDTLAMAYRLLVGGTQGFYAEVLEDGHQLGRCRAN